MLMIKLFLYAQAMVCIIHDTLQSLYNKYNYKMIGIIVVNHNIFNKSV